MSDDRTQAPSKLRLQQAREQGQAAHSPELTGAASLFAATVALSLFGESTAAAVLRLMRTTWSDEIGIVSTVDVFCRTLRSVSFEIGVPLLGILAIPPAAAILAHQAQVRGLFAPGLIAPNFARLMGGHSGGFGAKLGRGAWILAKTVVVVLIAVWTLRSRRDALVDMGGMDVPGLARAWSSSLIRTTASLGLASLALGLIDFTLQLRRFEAMLRLTPGEAREDMKAAEGDPALRARRVRVARSWRGDAPELLAGATLVVVGKGGLVVILGGGPPPKRVNIRSSAKGATGLSLRRSAEREEVPVLDNDALARKLAVLRLPSPPPELALDLKAAWPVREGSS